MSTSNSCQKQQTKKHRHNEKRHRCNVCNKLFSRPSALQTHMYTHTGEKPFQCPSPGCGKCFAVVSNLRRHSKVHSNTPSPRHRLSAQVRHQFIEQMLLRYQASQHYQEWTQQQQTPTVIH
ncbi:hypothetical protein BDA99DRAFT_437685 [Phascolomyces articulosus]|uniref:C2H2-type domain-containing protein n=1 Tax=Phascolomyces articulosus TaxID=60185 RepID=A0AAD5KB95_9FUNG|nr:hypothetical protein BDA99DRAFT_437685 [Phascolomyces articulosus]